MGSCSIASLGSSRAPRASVLLWNSKYVTMVAAVVALIVAESSQFSVGSPLSRNARGASRGSSSRFASTEVGASTDLSSFVRRQAQHAKGKRRAGAFEDGAYDKPIVLIGCRGAGDELNRLAASLLLKLHSAASTADTLLEQLQREEAAEPNRTTRRRNRGSIVPSVGANQRGVWVLDPADFHRMLDAAAGEDRLDKSNVIVLDFDAPVFNVDHGKHSDKLTSHLAHLAKVLYQQQRLLVIYVNVHPNASRMSRGGRMRKAALERDVFIKYSDFEICVKDEGLDAATVLSQKLILDSPSTDHTNTAPTHASLDANTNDQHISLQQFDSLTSSHFNDPFTQMRTISTSDQRDKLDAITDQQFEAWDGVQWELRRLIARATLPLAAPGSRYDDHESSSVNTASLTMGQHSFFLSLSFPDIMMNQPFIEGMCQDVDAMEFRADLLSCVSDRFEVLHSLQKLRRMCRTHAVRAPMLPLMSTVLEDALPIVFTVRTAHQAGTFPDDPKGIAKMFDLLELGLRSGVEVLDVESAWDPLRTNQILSQVETKYSTQVLGSHHVVDEEVSMEEAIRLFRQCSLQGRAHGAKVVLSIKNDKRDSMAHYASKAAWALARQNHETIVPHIGLILGEEGQYSRVLNLDFTPVTHESLPNKAAPGQLTASELMAMRVIMGLCAPKKYAILGHNIGYSVSPAMHSAAFAATSLPHSFHLIDVENVETIVKSNFWKDESFGGASVTIPHKQAIIPHLDVLTEAAKKIGAVNTVIVKDAVQESNRAALDDTQVRVLVGDNTDWKGMCNPLSRKLGLPCSLQGLNGDEVATNGVALILGAGGTARAAAYAASQLGLKRIYYNRTPEKAHELAAVFGGLVVTSLDGPTVRDPISEKFNLGDFEDVSVNDKKGSLGAALMVLKEELRVVICTLPASAEFELPNWIIQSAQENMKPLVVLDVNYKPYWTKLLHQANDAGMDIMRGSEMLWEQGVGQFELWTGRTAPYRVMKNAVLKNCLPTADEDELGEE